MVAWRRNHDCFFFPFKSATDYLAREKWFGERAACGREGGKEFTQTPSLRGAGSGRWENLWILPTTLRFYAMQCRYRPLNEPPTPRLIERPSESTFTHHHLSIHPPSIEQRTQHSNNNNYSSDPIRMHPGCNQIPHPNARKARMCTVYMTFRFPLPRPCITPAKPPPYQHRPRQQ
ncbi:hypothetical protein EJ05DRAFT_190190 [Pseudovirgaria hyperparasitica]|uniref:Uncharacterized protein n=1 Tax=Pseudovirgaria hyperparasitica TaxID=470096 RepID=A0A6A6WGG7_9PEZI|nr:uncharacterized protein EJ05DRAFT_190190 [Pseudovirgaria hyperparasitica]KAF2761952.1 hypothetical protein EJ05DRAFT_190190 [Pseudovirgaria hyperparasitica]